MLIRRFILLNFLSARLQTEQHHSCYDDGYSFHLEVLTDFGVNKDTEHEHQHRTAQGGNRHQSNKANGLKG